jgi:hypothetical protein
MGARIQTLEIIFEVQRKRINEKITRKEISLLTYKTPFFSFFLFGRLLLSNLKTFLFLIHFKYFKMLYEHHLKFYKSSLYFNNNKATCKEFFGCLGTSL